MPSTSKKQHNFFAAVANNPKFAKKAGVPTSVGKDFINADKGRKFKEGGNTMATKGVNPFAKFEKSGKDVEKKGMKEGSKADMAMDKKQMMGMKKGGPAKKMATGGMTKMGSVRTGTNSRDGVASKGKTQGKMVKMNYGGKAC